MDVAQLHEAITEARLAELAAWNAGNSRAAAEARELWELLLEDVPAGVTVGVAPALA